MKKHYLLLLIALLFSCSFNKYPSWYLQIDKDKTKIYGLGSGITIQEAQKIALSDIASQIKTTISSKTKSKFSEDSRIGIEKIFETYISTKVNDVSINSFEVINSDQISDGRFIIKIATSKQKLADDYILKLNKAKEELINNKDNYKNAHEIISKKKYMRKIINSQLDIVSIKEILSSLDETSTNQNSEIELLVLYQEKIEKLNRQLSFYIIGNDKNIQKEIQNIISASDFNIANTKNNDTIIIEFNAIKTKKTVFDENIVKINIEIDIFDSNNNKIGYNEINSSGSSILSAEDAERLAIKNISKNLQTQDISSFFGIED